MSLTIPFKPPFTAERKRSDLKVFGAPSVGGEACFFVRYYSSSLTTYPFSLIICSLVEEAAVSGYSGLRSCRSEAPRKRWFSPKELIGIRNSKASSPTSACVRSTFSAFKLASSIEKLRLFSSLYLTKSAGVCILLPEARFGYGAVDRWSPPPPVQVRAFALSQYRQG